MKYSDIALKLLAAKECGIIKTNARFWGSFSDREKLEKEVLDDDRVVKLSGKLLKELDLSGSEEGIVCVYDDDFPVINSRVKNKGDKPYLLFYRGDLALLHDLNNNVAVIGMTDPEEGIIKRETDIVRELVKSGLAIVSGLALGCDTAAHKTCVEADGKTIAILPSQLSRVYPAENRCLAEEIVEKGGLLVSEYYRDTTSKYEAINRFIERDRLQAMFSKTIILIASYRKGEGNCGSRHAMEAAKKYGIDRYVMYDREMDENNRQLGFNKDLADGMGADKVRTLALDSFSHIRSLENPNLFSEANSHRDGQLRFL